MTFPDTSKPPRAAPDPIRRAVPKKFLDSAAHRVVPVGMTGKAKEDAAKTKHDNP